MTVRSYYSSDSGAPVLSGTAGALCTVLDAVLVGTGGFAYGTTPSLGWSTAYTGTNLRAYRQPGGQQYYLKVRDDAPGSACDARIRGFETMTQVTATNDGTDGTNLFPTVALRANGVFARKSSGADATRREWIIIGDEQTFYMWVAPNDTAGYWRAWMFGDIYSTKSTTDLGKTMCAGSNTENTTTITDEQLDILATLGSITGQRYLNRDSSGSGNTSAIGAFVGNMTIYATTTSNVAMGNGSNFGLTLPSIHKAIIQPVRVAQSAVSLNIRGRMRGLWYSSMPDASLSHGQVFAGTGDLAGKTFMIIRRSGNGGYWIVETSNTWETN